MKKILETCNKERRKNIQRRLKKGKKIFRKFEKNELFSSLLYNESKTSQKEDKTRTRLKRKKTKMERDSKKKYQFDVETLEVLRLDLMYFLPFESQFLVQGS